MDLWDSPEQKQLIGRRLAAWGSPVDAKQLVGRRHPAPGALLHFIDRTLAAHVEPERRGTPKGAPIGFSRKKLHAALLYLTTLRPEEIARIVGTSLGLVRKWRTELAFLARITQAAEDFLAGLYGTALMDTAAALAKATHIAEDAGASADARRAAGIFESDPLLLAFGDVNLYGGVLAWAITETLAVRWVDLEKRLAALGKTIPPATREMLERIEGRVRVAIVRNLRTSGLSPARKFDVAARVDLALHAIEAGAVVGKILDGLTSRDVRHGATMLRVLRMKAALTLPATMVAKLVKTGRLPEWMAPSEEDLAPAAPARWLPRARGSRQPQRGKKRAR